MSMALATEYEVVIGLEAHVQLNTKSKMFCACSAAYHDAEPNVHVCPVCLGLPGALPVINEQAVAFTALTGLALHCTVPRRAKFDRKNYPYPDLVKGYQISQFDVPIADRGWLLIDNPERPGETRRIGVTRVHLEEDVAKLQHRGDSASGERYSLVDVNRSGVPLMEVVGEPDLRSPEEARRYLVKLRTILRYLGVSDADMERGGLRCDANISLRPRGVKGLGAKVEVKNMNSLRGVVGALSFEAERQLTVLREGRRVPQETRGWIEERGETISQRSKEHAHDYRYFPEPDLPPIVFEPAEIEDLRRRLPELPDEKRERFRQQYGLSDYDAGLLTAGRATADYFEATAALVAHGASRPARTKAVANWLNGELAHHLNTTQTEIDAVKILPRQLNDLLELVDEGTVNQTAAKDVFAEMFRTGEDPRTIIEAQGLQQISGSDELDALAAQVLTDNPKAVSDFRAGKESAIGFLVGQAMKATRGRANPNRARDVLLARLGGSAS